MSVRTSVCLTAAKCQREIFFADFSQNLFTANCLFCAMEGQPVSEEVREALEQLARGEAPIKKQYVICMVPIKSKCLLLARLSTGFWWNTTKEITMAKSKRTVSRTHPSSKKRLAMQTEKPLMWTKIWKQSKFSRVVVILHSRMRLPTLELVPQSDRRLKRRVRRRRPPRKKKLLQKATKANWAKSSWRRSFNRRKRNDWR